MRSTLVLLACAASLGAPTLRSASQAEDPPLRVTVRIDGIEHHVEDGEEFSVVVGGEEVRAGVSVHRCRRFEHAGIRFDFPRDMAFAYEKSEGVEMWTLDGDDCVLHVQAFEAGDAPDLARSLLLTMQHGLDADAQSPRQHDVELGGEARSGLRARAHVAELGVGFELTAVGVVANDRPIVLLLQETLDEEESSPEAARIFDLLAESFFATKTD